MHTVTAEYPVQLEKSEVWLLLRDLSKPDMYVQGLTAVEFTTSQRIGVGTSRRVTQGKFMQLDETVTQWMEGNGFTLRLHRGDKGPIPPFSSHFFDYGVVQRGDQVYLRNSMRWEVGLGPLGALLNSLVLKRLLSTQLHKVTLAQKIYYQTGERVTPEILKAAEQVQ